MDGPLRRLTPLPLTEAGVPVVGLDDVEAIADLVLRLAEPLDAVLARLEDA